MTVVRRILLGLLIGLGLTRAISYFVYAAASLANPLESYYLEAKMVLLAYRAELGVTLYPEWRDYPHVANFFGPAYFAAVGLVGRAIGADIPGLFRIGRTASFAAGLLTSVVVGLVAARRYGRTAGVVGSLLSLGTAPTFGFSVMVRPDVPAEFLGVAGFFLASARSSLACAIGGAVLVLAILTKQTTVIYLLAASVALGFEGQWRRGVWLGVGSSIALAVVVGGVTLFFEPNFAASLAGESATPMDRGPALETLTRLVRLSPDTLVLPVIGLGLWLLGPAGRRNGRLAALAVLLLAYSFATSAKRGSDLNYYLGLRAVEGLAVAALWQAGATASGRARAGLALALLLACVAVVPGVLYAGRGAISARRSAAYLASPVGRDFVEFYREACALAARPDARLLTDSGLIDLHQGTRAAFGDPWLFRMLTETGRIDPALIRERIDAQYYDMVITTTDLMPSSYDSHIFALPKTLADRVREHYVEANSGGGRFVYVRRPGATSPGDRGP